MIIKFHTYLANAALYRIYSFIMHGLKLQRNELKMKNIRHSRIYIHVYVAIIEYLLHSFG